MPNPIPGRWWRLYHRPTRPEVYLEPLIAAQGVPYRFQHPIPGTPWIADYGFPSLRILLEIDGGSHQSLKAQEKDRARDQKTSELGWKTVRVTNDEALRASEADVAQWLGLT